MEDASAARKEKQRISCSKQANLAAQKSSWLEAAMQRLRCGRQAMMM
jgi:hypothetical protein